MQEQVNNQHATIPENNHSSCTSHNANCPSTGTNSSRIL